MQIFLFLIFLISQVIHTKSEIPKEAKSPCDSAGLTKKQKKSCLYSRKKKLDFKIQYLRDKINDQEADTSEDPAKFYQALQERKKITKQLKNLE